MRHQSAVSRPSHESFRDAFARQLSVLAASLLLLLVYVAIECAY
jgi:hypothetical protein